MLISGLRFLLYLPLIYSIKVNCTWSNLIINEFECNKTSCTCNIIIPSNISHCDNSISKKESGNCISKNLCCVETCIDKTCCQYGINICNYQFGNCYSYIYTANYKKLNLTKQYTCELNDLECIENKYEINTNFICEYYPYKHTLSFIKNKIPEIKPANIINCFISGILFFGILFGLYKT